MLERIFSKIARKFAEYSDTDKEDIYIYGLEIIISTTIGLSSILLLSYMLSSFMSGLVFLSIFAPLRLFTGGYHASSYGRCFIISNLSFLLVLIIGDIIWEKLSFWGWMFLLSFLRYYIITNAPVVNSNQPISKSKQRQNKKNARLILIFDIVWIIYLSINQKKLMVIAILGICLVGIFMLIPKKLDAFQILQKGGTGS